MSHPCFIDITLPEGSPTSQEIISFFREKRAEQNQYGGVIIFPGTKPVFDIEVNGFTISFDQRAQPCHTLFQALYDTFRGAEMDIDYAEPCNSLFGKFGCIDGKLVTLPADEAKVEMYFI